MFWASGMVGPPARWGGLNSEDSTFHSEDSAFLAFPAQFGLMMFGSGADLRLAARRVVLPADQEVTAPHEAWGRDGRPHGPQSTG
ncbi:hypothetical protein C4B68_02435 [Streptomyces dengpaensis]|uniref:Uncharacterized protein n=1 Tax=Streptomyces dengpaensis TaxID=2049881 RepID=A0ABN5HW72_9ACTN|nr:hypothetical protein C4B68_02435 [Streptomyces dengpaensis]PIA98577.1 hypothetical protein B1C81_39300 [Streptomyces sp. HG99]